MTKILIGEDEPDIRDLIEFTLTYGGYDVTVKKNGAEVVEVAADIMPDLIMLDVRMPRMTGYEACRALKADDKVKHIPVIFLSAKGQEAEVQLGLEAGAMDYLLKPFAPDVLIKRIGEILEQTKKA
jgi:DNA-binding response OmpR family regulator